MVDSTSVGAIAAKRSASSFSTSGSRARVLDAVPRLGEPLLGALGLLGDLAGRADHLEQLLVARGDRGLDLVDLAGQLGEGGRAVLRGADHLAQVRHAPRDRGCVDVVPGDGADRLEGVEPLAAPLAFHLDVLAAGLRLEQGLLGAGALLLEHGALGAVVEAEHPLGAVVDLPVGVLLVPGGGVLDLAGAEHRPVQAGELLEALGAGVVHARGDLVGEPHVELAVLDVELRGQGALVDVLRGRRRSVFTRL
jgi:hypothetical protein